MEEKKKSKKGIVLIIIGLIIIILGLVGYICYDKGLIFKTEKEVVKKEKKKNKVLSGEEAKKLLERFGIDHNTAEKYSDEAKFGAAIADLDDNKFSKYKCNELLSNEVSKWDTSGSNGEGYSMINPSTYSYYCSNEVENTLFPYKEVNKKYKEMFDKEIKKETIGYYYYVEKYDGFAFLPYADGTRGPTVEIDEVKDVSVKGNKLLINAYLEEIPALDEKQFKVGDNYISYNFDNPDSVKFVKKEIVEKYLDNVKSYKIVFNIKNNKYIFKSIEAN